MLSDGEEYQQLSITSKKRKAAAPTLTFASAKVKAASDKSESNLSSDENLDDPARPQGQGWIRSRR